MKMNVIRDYLTVNRCIKGCAHKSRRPVMERYHAVKKMCDMVDAVLQYRTPCRIVISGAVTERNYYSVFLTFLHKSIVAF